MNRLILIHWIVFQNKLRSHTDENFNRKLIKISLIKKLIFINFHQINLNILIKKTNQN